ncbi:hypothetical protein [Aureispira anguillae]|uniref:Uncharacterized protein n=1 Tax=Aureispira anguillae TaxID=2864201 RepID=A0A916DSV7_9BACT|nr:hypothetical protein [Aureispira anguillae]BDS12774.1 hypothetical protein AsAng_0034990 [Aureispira anguillae]
MKKQLTLLTFFFLAICCSTPENKPSEEVLNEKITGIFAKDVKILIPEGEFLVDVLDAVKVDPRLQELQAKLMKAVELNREWFIEQQKIMQETGSPVEYHPNLGLTESEYNELNEFTKSGTGMEVQISETEDVEFIYIGDELTFKSKNKLDLLNLLKIDVKEKKAWLDGFELNDFTEINVDNDKNGLRTKWKGYKWSYTTSNEVDLKELGEANVSSYSFTLGQLEIDNSTYMEIKAKEIVNGEKVLHTEIPFKF